MFKLLNKLVPLARTESALLTAETLSQQQQRTTYILKRRVAPYLHKKGFPARRLRSRHYVYDLVRNTVADKQPLIDLVLTSYVDGLGNVGDKVSVRSEYGYNNILLPGLGVYATPNNLEKYQSTENIQEDTEHYSSPVALKMMASLSRLSLAIVMNKDSPWTIKPWHIRASFRKCGYIVPEEAIEIPQKSISGPNLEIDGKSFYATVTINNTEKVKVKCTIRHWSTVMSERIPYVYDEFWKKEPDFLFPEDASSIK